ncbi:DUF6473 family protein [Ruegeria arenilitoris]|uniref:DUF6473 family protein n=1 Tax=Ruegeria arenilitoris TaxID=1173585 RepID=UPI0020C248A6|nr:DUF6473 family protein [Ruegeria arenilitoris]
MSYHQTGSAGAGHAVCQYGQSRLWFRGPERSLDTAYMACVGGDETHGRFVDRPYAAILEDRLDRRCLNLGSLYCGVEALCGDAGLFTLLNGAELCVLQAPGVLSQSNHFYRVHPRRNDRVLAPTQDLIDFYPEVDFTDVHFVGHLMRRLQDCQDARFEVVAEELRRNWVRQISDLLQRLKVPVLLLALKVLPQKNDERQEERAPITVTLEMLKAVRPFCADYVEATAYVSGQSDELEDMLFGTLQQPMAEHMIGPAAHRSIAEALVGPIRNLQ